MLKLSTKKTTTLWYDRDNPSVSILPGHVTTRDFNKAYKAEGWNGDWVHKDNLSFEYWRPLTKTWKRSTKEDKKAKPVTVMGW